jgi:hypothetical protein
MMPRFSTAGQASSATQPSFRAIDGDDAEVLWPDVLDPLLDLPPGLADEAFL